MWQLVFQRDKRPISVARADGVDEEPPSGLIRYIELAYPGETWTVAPATAPVGVEGVEWPHPCVWVDVTGYTGEMLYVEHVKKHVIIKGEPCYPAGWQCQKCGNEQVHGIAVMTIDSVVSDPDPPD
jgi:hypothetical protein